MSPAIIEAYTPAPELSTQLSFMHCLLVLLIYASPEEFLACVSTTAACELSENHEQSCRARATEPILTGLAIPRRGEPYNRAVIVNV